MATIQWYPGHIAKAQAVLRERLKLVDFVLELADARLPGSSRFAMTKELLGDKPRVLVFTKADLADEGKLKRWLAHYRATGLEPVVLNANTGQGLPALKKQLQEHEARINAKMAARGRLPRASRVMVVGLPNVGKSSLINRLAGKRAANVGDKPGVTRDVRWIRLGKGLELLDTPGIIPPKLEDPDVALRLVLIGAVSDEAYDPVDVAPEVWPLVKAAAPAALPVDTLAEYAVLRGCLGPGGAPDVERASRTFIREIRGGQLGAIGWEEPPQA